MFEEEIEIVKKNLHRQMRVNATVSMTCMVIGYGILPSLLGDDKKVFKVLLKKETKPSRNSFDWKTQLMNYVVLSDKDMNPEDFISVPYNCIKKNNSDYFISCY